MDLELVCIGLFAFSGCVFFILFLTCFQTALMQPAAGAVSTAHGALQELAAHHESSTLASRDVNGDDGLLMMVPTASAGTLNHPAAPELLTKSASLRAGQYASNLYFMKRLSRSLTAERSAHIMPCIIKEFSVAEIEAATSKFASSSMLRHGHSGDIFKGALERGETVVIKRVICSNMHKSKHGHNNILVDGIYASAKDYYATEMDVYGKVLDQTFLVPVLGQCLASQEEKYLVYEYMAHGDLASILARARAASNILRQKAERQPQLHRQESADRKGLDNNCNVCTSIKGAMSTSAAGDGGAEAILTWPVRVRIARQVAEALVYLHHGSRPPLSHRNIQGSSILLNKDFEVKLGSLGDAQKIESGELPVYDIYCFGRLLLDLVSGLDISGNGRDEAVQAWVGMCFHALTTVPHIKKVFKLQLMDRNLVPLMQEHHLLEMIQVAHLAKLCMEPTTLQKLSVKEVLDLLPA